MLPLRVIAPLLAPTSTPFTFCPAILPYMSRPRRATAADVAEEAGVSTTTVSYVLNATPGQKISEATAQRVRAAAERLNYVLNPAARALARGESSFVIVDSSAFPRSDSSETALNAFIEYLENFGYTTLPTWWGHDDWESDVIRFAIETSASRVVTSIPVSSETAHALRTAGVKTVSSMLASAEELKVPVQLAAEEQVRYLAAQGHSHLLYVPEADPKLARLNLPQETAGARAAAAHGLQWIPVRGSSTAQEYCENIKQALVDHPESSALIAFDDHVALGVLSALQALDVAVPERTSVIGAGNLPFTDTTYPPLTTVEYTYVIDAVAPEMIREFVEGEGQAGLVSSLSDPWRSPWWDGNRWGRHTGLPAPSLLTTST